MKQRRVLGTPKTKRNTEGTRGRREKAETRTNKCELSFRRNSRGFPRRFSFFLSFFFATVGRMLVYTFDTKCVLVKRKSSSNDAYEQGKYEKQGELSGKSAWLKMRCHEVGERERRARENLRQK